MATLALTAAGAAIGSALLPAGVSAFGVAISGATIGAQIGALAGSFVDQALFAPSGQSRALAGPRLGELAVSASTEGAAVPRVYGRVRLGGQIIWARDIEEEIVTTETGGGGKGGGGGGGSSSSVDYRYYASFAVGICEGPVTALLRVWADGQELDLTTVVHRFHVGSETQAPDPLITDALGSDRTPAYRGVAYIVLERLPLQPYGNRLPQLAFEIVRAVDHLHEVVRGVVLIPGSGEFVYATDRVTRPAEAGGRVAENVHTRRATSDWHDALDQLAVALPNVGSVSLFVCWFGSDLRAGHCEIRPKVELPAKDNAPLSWSVGGLARGDASVVSTEDGRPSYGGTPSDQTVIGAIRDLKLRGKKVVLSPVLLMDIPSANGLEDPYSGAAEQPKHPWRGRITTSPAPGQPGSPDKTAAAASQIAAFVGTAAPAHFAVLGEAVLYSGPVEWSYRRFILHYAHLALAAGGVDAFVIGSELRGLTTARSAVSTYPFVAALAALAAEVRAILGPATRITYAADWSEWFGHQPADGSGDVHFHLDPLWSSPSIDAIGIDLYWPLADWRDGRDHVDATAGATSPYDLAYLKSNLTGGEGYDWYYASDADRASQTRTAITDGAGGTPWVFRYKDIRSWWLNEHRNRPGGMIASVPTTWQPQSKPIWLMEVGCPAVDRAANQPNVFIDARSSESRLPHFSSGRRDDLAQRRYLSAILEAIDPAHPGSVPGLNPLSSVYGGRMIDVERAHAYAWDARPWPAFPRDRDTWSDGDNWSRGHWLQGRIWSAPLAETVGQILRDSGFTDFDVSRIYGMVPGYAIDRLLSAREALQPLELAYFLDAVATQTTIRFQHREDAPVAATLTTDGLVETAATAPLLTLSRAQESELPAAAKVHHISADDDYRRSTAEARRLAVQSSRISEADLAVVLEPERAAEIAETWLHESWIARERAGFSLPPSALAIEPGDAVGIETAAGTRLFRVTSIGSHGSHDVEALALEPSVYRPGPAIERTSRWRPAAPVGAADVVFLDLPTLGQAERAVIGHVAASAAGWPGGIALLRSPETTGFVRFATIAAPCVIGRLTTALGPGPTSRLDRLNRPLVAIASGELASVTALQMLAGANAAAVECGGGQWEIIQFERAELVEERAYELSGLLRGQAGTEDLTAVGAAAGARVVLLGPGLTALDLGADEIAMPYQWRFGPLDRDISHPDYAQTVFAAAGRALLPLAPVHIRGVRSGGSLEITWVRRTRIGGDGWEQVEVPMVEAPERYEVDIMDGAAVKRTISTDTTSATYGAADQMADFGAPQANVSLRIFQLSPTRGRGLAATAAV